MNYSNKKDNLSCSSRLYYDSKREPLSKEIFDRVILKNGIEKDQVISVSSQKPSEPILSVIMVSYYTGSIVFKAIESLMKLRQIHEIIFVNNGNPKSIEKRLSDLADENSKFILIGERKNIGFSRACNLGAKKAIGTHFLFLNPDAILDEQALNILLSKSQNLPSPWCVGGRILNINRQEQQGSRRNELTLFSAFSSFLGLYKISNLNSFFAKFFKNFHKHHEAVPEEMMQVSVISGACMLMKKSDFNQLGGFDENYFLHVEDVDLCRRVNQLGGGVYFIPQAEIIHLGSTSQVLRLKIEWEKSKSFAYYFYKFSKNPLEKILTVLLSPLITLILLIRGLFSVFCIGKQSKHFPLSSNHPNSVKNIEEIQFK